MFMYFYALCRFLGGRELSSTAYSSKICVFGILPAFPGIPRIRGIPPDPPDPIINGVINCSSEPPCHTRRGSG